MVAEPVAGPMGEPQRSQYLEAMGLTAWVSRYRLPNALETPRCEWREAPVEPRQPPAERLHALLDDAREAGAPSPSAPADPAPAPVSPPVKRARALLGEPASEPEPATPAEPQVEEASREVGEAPGEALRFTLQVAALEGRWLVLQVGDVPPSSAAQRLLANLFKAAGIETAQPPSFEAFRWPLMEGIPAQAPFEEAREGLRAFIEGRRRRGWQPERLLLFGAHDDLEQVLGIVEGRSRLLEIPAWRGPALDDMMASAGAKRDLLPMLREWREAWRRGAEPSDEGGASGD
ncbi:hypothetical protein [Modicisalibacter radicis]|uniref:hypothetical protein n=1 Tax=Halomonas sp. EAR18 TaxID=2518972 RepID=UPI00109D6A50|nr:hypothetical protein [Halomonas sp. EAR18]